LDATAERPGAVASRTPPQPPAARRLAEPVPYPCPRTLSGQILTIAPVLHGGAAGATSTVTRILPMTGVSARPLAREGVRRRGRLLDSSRSITLGMAGQLGRPGRLEMPRLRLDLDADPVAGERLALLLGQDLDLLSHPPHLGEDLRVERPPADLRDGP